MAIYKNREVHVGKLTQSSTPAKLIQITSVDGETENVSLGAVRFTAEEKKQLQKDYNDSYFDNLDTVSDDDLKAVRLGIAPTYDQESKKLAEDRALQARAAEENQKIADKHKQEAEKNLDKKLKSNEPQVKKVNT